jgi:hypothetical protein
VVGGASVLAYDVLHPGLREDTINGMIGVLGRRPLDVSGSLRHACLCDPASFRHGVVSVELLIGLGGCTPRDR